MTNKLRKEELRVKDQNRRAEQLGLPATLTTKQWLAAIEYFNWHCAYCPKSFNDLEHFIALHHKGGTTADNCIPACNPCNVKKSKHRTSNLDTLFPAENLARIRAYLASVQ